MSKIGLVLQRTAWVLVVTILVFTGLLTPTASAESVLPQSKLFVADQFADYAEVRLKMVCDTSVSQVQDEYESTQGGRHLGSTQVNDALKLTVEGTVGLRAGVAANLTRDFPMAVGMPDTYRGTPGHPHCRHQPGPSPAVSAQRGVARCPQDDTGRVSDHP